MRCHASSGGRATIMCVAAAALISTAGTSTVSAQVVDPMTTDRPDRTESASTVGPGSVQIETGWTSTVRRGGATREVADELPQTLVRIGVSGVLELRVGYSGWERVVLETNSMRSSDWDSGGPELGFKYAIQGESDRRPAVAVLAGVGFSSFEHAGALDGGEPVVLAAVARTLSRRFSLGGNLGLAWREADGAADSGPERESVYSVVLGTDLGRGFGSFVELFGALAIDGTRRERHSLDGGVTWAASPNLQFDLSAGLGLNGSAEEYFIAAGFSFRFFRLPTTRPMG